MEFCVNRYSLSHQQWPPVKFNWINHHFASHCLISPHSASYLLILPPSPFVSFCLTPPLFPSSYLLLPHFISLALFSISSIYENWVNIHFVFYVCVLALFHQLLRCLWRPRKFATFNSLCGCVSFFSYCEIFGRGC